MTTYVHKESLKEVTFLLKSIKTLKRNMATSSRSASLRLALIDSYHARLGELVEAGLIAFMDK